MKGIYVNAISKSSHNFNNKISIVVVKEMLLLVIYLKYFKQDKISCSFPPVCKKLHNLRILLKKTIKKNCSTFAFDLLLSEWVDWTAVGEEEPLSIGKMSGKNEFWSGKCQGILFQIEVGTLNGDSTYHTFTFDLVQMEGI